MNISSVGGSGANPFFQNPAQTTGGQVIQQGQVQQTQAAAEEAAENTATQKNENSQGGEAQESGRINIYA
jgi:hypothetical protein